MSALGSPYLNGADNDFVGIGDINWPPIRSEGVARVDVGTSQKIDVQKADGTNKAVIKRNGTDPADLKITFRFTYRIWLETAALRNKLDPNREEKGGPFDIISPETDDRAVKSIIVQKMSPLTFLSPGLYEFTIDATEWVPPPKPKPGSGTSTPTAAQQWVQSPNQGRAFSSPTAGGAPSAPAGQTSAPGFNRSGGGVTGANGPDAEP